MSQPRLLVGLGNPGAKYEATRHNIGFRVLDAVAAHYDAPPWRARFTAAFSEIRVGDRKVLLLKPQTFMNQSGRSVAPALKYHNLTVDDAIVVYDELDLPPGKVRVKHGGGLAGHNGLRSINAHCGPGFWRMRVGIGHPGQPEKVSGYVLHPFPKADETWITPLLDEVPRLLPLLLENNEGEFMNRLHQRLGPVLEPEKPEGGEPSKA